MNTASEQMLNEVKAAQVSMKKARMKFILGHEDVKRAAAKKTINLFGGSAVSEVGAITSQVRRIGDAYYATCQMLVKLLDGKCRPLLEESPDYVAVRDVCNMIISLNEASEIEHQFSATINGEEIGDVANGYYQVPIESRMVESFWKTKLDFWPGKKEAEEAERQRKKEESEAANERYCAELSVYEQELAEWQLKADEIEANRSKELERMLLAEKKARLGEIEEAYKKAVKRAQNQIKSSEKNKQEAEVKLSSLGFFKFGEKKQAKQLIEEMLEKIEEANKMLEEAEQTRKDDIQKIDSLYEEKKKEYQEKVREKYPMPMKPKKPFRRREVGADASERDLFNEAMKEAILDGMESGEVYTVGELLREIPELDGWTTQKLTPLVKAMADEGVLEQVEDVDRRLRYRLA